MKPNYKTEPQLLDNQNRFTDPFFQRFQLRKRDQPLLLEDGTEKDYSFPTFYGNVTCAMAIFQCNYQAAKQLLPHPAMEPVKGTRGRAIVAFSCYEYKEVLGIPPYNEIAMTIPVMVHAGYHPPLLPLVMDAFKKQGFYVFSMPVTSHENTQRGHKIWGLPKVTEEITIETQDGHCTTEAFDEQGNSYFKLKVPTDGKPKHFDETGYLYSVLDDELLKSQTNFKGDFNVQMRLKHLFGKSAAGSGPWLQLGDSPRADVLKQLQLEQEPFQFRYCPGMNSCFDLAEQRWKY